MASLLPYFSRTGRYQSYLDPIAIAHGNFQHLLPLPIVSTLNGPKFLHQPYNRITRLRQRQLLAGTYPWAAAKRQVVPALPPRLPSLGSELFGVVAKDVLAAVHDVAVCGDEGAFGNEYRGTARGAAAGGEYGVIRCLPGICRDQGKEAKS